MPINIIEGDHKTLLTLDWDMEHERKKSGGIGAHLSGSRPPWESIGKSHSLSHSTARGKVPF